MTAFAPVADIIMRIFILIIFCILITSCSDDDTSSTFDKYPKSGEVTSFPFENGKAFQSTYYLYMDYPYSGALSHYESVINQPWIACKPWKEGWEGYLDTSGEEPIYVHRITRHWANNKANRLLMLLLQYNSKTSTCVEVPDNNTQEIILVEYIESDLQRTLDLLKLSCS